jgi:TonB family protein
MSVNQIQGAYNLLGQVGGAPPMYPRQLPGHLTPRLDVAWGEFRQSLLSSVVALFGPRASKDFHSAGFFRECWIERRISRRAVLAAALWHIVFVIMPSPKLPAPRRNPAFDNAELTWSGPIEDLPLLDIPKEKAKPSPRGEPDKSLPPQGADALHPRQRIFTDPVHPTHPRQTLINPGAPFEAPKLLPSLPNMVQFQQAPAPERPKLEISEDDLKKIRPRERRVATVTSAPLPNVPNMEQRPAEMSLAVTTSGPARPKLEINAGAAPRVAAKAQSGEVGPAPDVSTTHLSAPNGGANALIALSANPAPPAPAPPPPQGNLAARVSISPEGKQPGVPGGAPKAPPSAATAAAAGSSRGASTVESAGKNSVGVSISGGNPAKDAGASGLAGAAPKMSAPTPHSTRPSPRVRDEDIPERTGPPNFAALAAGAKPEQIFASKRVYTMNVNMPNLNSATGSWILNFAELRSNPDGPRIVSSDLSGPVPLKKIDPKYPPALISDRFEGEVVLYAVIRKDGSVDSIQLVHGIHEQLDENAMNALAQWKFRPGNRQGVPVELEAIVHIPFHIPVEQ